MEILIDGNRIPKDHDIFKKYKSQAIVKEEFALLLDSCGIDYREASTETEDVETPRNVSAIWVQHQLWIRN